jgi:hypothetical protein
MPKNLSVLRNAFFRKKLFSKTNLYEIIIPNPLSNPQTIPLFEKSSQIMKRKVILLLMFVFFYSNINAQLGTVSSQNDPVTVTNIDSFFSAAKKVTASNGAKLNAQNLKTLTTNVQSSVYCYSNTVNTYGEKPVDLFTDIHSLAQVDNLVTLKNDIEIVIIKIDNETQLNSSINLAFLSNFKKLKYIYIVSSINTTPSVIANMITNYDEKYSVFYKITKGDNQ